MPTSLSENTISQIKQIFRDVINNESNTFPMCITMSARVASIEKEKDQNRTDIEKLENSIKGNGKGIIERLNDHENQIAQLVEFMKEVKGLGKWLVLFMAGIFLTSVVNLILNNTPVP